MVHLRLLWKPEATGEQSGRPGEIALVGQSARRDDPAFGHELGAWRLLFEFVPEAGHLAILLHRSPTVGENGMLFGASACQLDERFELRRCLLPPAETIQGKPVQLSTSNEVRRLFYDWCEDLSSFLVAIT